jgi:hypothetical protein
MTVDCFTTPYKTAFVQFLKDQSYDWSITIGIGFCPPDDETLKRLNMIDAILSKKYLVGRYHKLPADARFLILIAFEGERSCGNRHAHTGSNSDTVEELRAARAFTRLPIRISNALAQTKSHHRYRTESTGVANRQKKLAAH